MTRSNTELKAYIKTWRVVHIASKPGWDALEGALDTMDAFGANTIEVLYLYTGRPPIDKCIPNSG